MSVMIFLSTVAILLFPGIISSSEVLAGLNNNAVAPILSLLVIKTGYWESGLRFVLLNRD